MKYSSFKAQSWAISIILLWTSNLYISLVMTPNSNFLCAVLIFFQTFLSVGLFITAHDSMHGLLTPNKKLNDFYGKICLYLYAAFSFKKLKDAHIEHHKNPVSNSDPDYTMYSTESYLLWFWSFMRRYYGLREFFLMHFHVLILMWVAGWSYPKVLIFYALPAIISALQLFTFGTYLPHRTNKKHNNRHNARSNELPVWLSFLTCYHFGYHFEHHEYPNTPWWALPSKRFKKRRMTNV